MFAYKLFGKYINFVDTAIVSTLIGLCFWHLFLIVYMCLSSNVYILSILARQLLSHFISFDVGKCFHVI